MAIKLTSNYSKKAGLPNYSSHQFSVCVETELTDLGQVQGEVTRLYGLLQDAVDREMQHVGFVPDEAYGIDPDNSNGGGTSNGNGNGSGGKGNPNGNGHTPSEGDGGRPPRRDTSWKCSDKQKDLILKLVAEHDLDRNLIEELAIERFGHGVRELNKLQASGLIDEILETYASNGNGKRRGSNGNRGNGNYPRNRSCSAAAKGGRP